jgi:hypothetical protein
MARPPPKTTLSRNRRAGRPTGKARNAPDHTRLRSSAAAASRSQRYGACGEVNRPTRPDHTGDLPVLRRSKKSHAGLTLVQPIHGL